MQVAPAQSSEWPPRGWALYRSDLGDYMRRWILRTPWGMLRIHNIQKSDEGRDFHDHPFHFTSVILRGGYVEHRPGCACLQGSGWRIGESGYDCARYEAPAIVRRKAEDMHRLELLDGVPAWTLVVSSRFLRSWGFLTPEGWVGYKEYHRSYY